MPDYTTVNKTKAQCMHYAFCVYFKPDYAKLKLCFVNNDFS